MQNVVFFLKRMFGLDRARTVGRIQTTGTTNAATSTVSEANQLRYAVVRVVTWFMGFALVVSLLGIVGFALLNRDPPQVLSQLLFATLGYFGGAFASFMQSNSAQMSST